MWAAPCSNGNTCLRGSCLSCVQIFSRLCTRVILWIRVLQFNICVTYCLNVPVSHNFVWQCHKSPTCTYVPQCHMYKFLWSCILRANICLTVTGPEQRKSCWANARAGRDCHLKNSVKECFPFNVCMKSHLLGCFDSNFQLSNSFKPDAPFCLIMPKLKSILMQFLYDQMHSLLSAFAPAAFFVVLVFCHVYVLSFWGITQISDSSSITSCLLVWGTFWFHWLGNSSQKQ